MLNLSRYLPALEDFPIDAPVAAPVGAIPAGTLAVPAAPLAHEQAPGAVGVGVEPAILEQQPAVQVEIPEAPAPEMIASSDEAQAAANQVDAAHEAAATDSAAAIAADAQKLEGADVAPGQESPAAAEGGVTGDDAAAASEVGGDLGAVPAEGTAPVEGEEPAAGGDDLSGLGGEPGAAEEPAADLGAETGGDTPAEGTEPAAEEPASSEEPPAEEPAAGEEAAFEETPAEEPPAEEPAAEETPATEPAAEEPPAEEPAAAEETPPAEEEPASEEPPAEEESEEDEVLADGFDDTDEDAPDLEEGEIDVPDVDTEVTDEDVADAEVDSEEAKAADEDTQDEIVDTNKTIAELKKEEASVEKFIEILQHGIRTKQHSPQLLALAQDKLTELGGVFGRHSPAIPSMENYTRHNLDDYYTNSLESFVGFQRRITHLGKKLVDKVAKSLNESMHINAVSKEVATLNKRADKLLVGLKDLDDGYVLEVTKVPMHLRTEKPLVTAVGDEIKNLTAIGGKIFKADTAFITGLIAITNEATKEADGTKSIALANKALKLPLAEKSYPAQAFSGDMFGGWKINRSDKKATGDLVGDMKTLAERSIPTGDADYVAKAGGKASLKKADLIKLMQFAKVLIGISNSTKAGVGRSLMDSLNTANEQTSARHLEVKQGDKDQVKKAEKAMDELTSQLWAAVGRSLDNYGAFQWHICYIVDAINGMVGRAVK